MYIVCHYHEIGLKGKNRKFFEEKLVENIKKSLPKDSFEFVKRISGRIIVKLTDTGLKQKDKIKKSLKNVFGMVFFIFACNVKPEIKIINKKALEILEQEKFKTFRIRTQRSDKDFPLKSPKVSETVGAFIVKNLKKKVKLENPDITLFIEITRNHAFLYTEKISAYGGLPVGVGNKAVVLLSGGIDSPVAGFLTMKRGVKAIFVHFHARPYTDEASIDKVKRIVKILNKFQFNSKLYLIPFADVQKQILLKVSARLRVIFYRRLMMKIAEVVAKKEKALALVTGDSIGQVASQTLENIFVISEAVNMPILRPLIGFDKEEIIDLAKKIDTFDVSILPHQDCCARFLPARVETKADLKQVKSEEKKLDVEELIEKALESTKLLTILK
ncbi:MAG: tRNA 4-thiouridine(8) synthase ThiI [Patescibacteria group bacterium]|nr:tRNA 4-thiouridine(8) synthase ThiI [Patescibacteria group bacterium]